MLFLFFVPFALHWLLCTYRGFVIKSLVHTYTLGIRDILGVGLYLLLEDSD